MSLPGFYRLALKGAAWLNRPDEARPMLEKLVALDTAHRPGLSPPLPHHGRGLKSGLPSLFPSR